MRSTLGLRHLFCLARTVQDMYMLGARRPESGTAPTLGSSTANAERALQRSTDVTPNW